MRATSLGSTSTLLARCRLRLALFDDNKWRREAWARSTLPDAVILNRLATAFFVFLRATRFGIRREKVSGAPQLGKPNLLHPVQNVEIEADHHRDDGAGGEQTEHRAGRNKNDKAADQRVFGIMGVHGDLLAATPPPAKTKPLRPSSRGANIGAPPARQTNTPLGTASTGTPLIAGIFCSPIARKIASPVAGDATRT